MPKALSKIVGLYNQKLEIDKASWLDATNFLLDEYEKTLSTELIINRQDDLNIIDEKPFQTLNRNFYFNLKNIIKKELTICGTLFINNNNFNEINIEISTFIVLNGMLFMTRDEHCIFVYKYNLEQQVWQYLKCYQPHMSEEFDYIPDKFKEIFPDIGW